jgi:hypothetical protein
MAQPLAQQDDDHESVEEGPGEIEPLRLKPPRQYKTTDDFHNFINRTEFWFTLTQVPIPQRAPVLLTLLDDHAFEIASGLELGDLREYDNVKARLLERFAAAAGPIGYRTKLKNRLQLSTETPREFLERITVLADKCQYTQEEKRNKILETLTDNTRDQEVRDALLKLKIRIPVDRWNTVEAYNLAIDKINDLEKRMSLATINKVSKLRVAMATIHEETPQALTSETRNQPQQANSVQVVTNRPPRPFSTTFRRGNTGNFRNMRYFHNSNLNYRRNNYNSNWQYPQRTQNTSSFANNRTSFTTFRGIQPNRRFYTPFYRQNNARYPNIRGNTTWQSQFNRWRGRYQQANVRRTNYTQYNPRFNNLNSQGRPDSGTR